MSRVLDFKPVTRVFGFTRVEVEMFRDCSYIIGWGRTLPPKGTESYRRLHLTAVRRLRAGR